MKLQEIFVAFPALVFFVGIRKVFNLSDFTLLPLQGENPFVYLFPYASLRFA